MALIKCPECLHTISDQAPFCPRCGYQISKFIGYTENQKQGKDLIISSSIALIASIFFFIDYLLIQSNLRYLVLTLGIILLITSIILKNIGKFKYWYHN